MVDTLNLDKKKIYSQLFEIFEKELTNIFEYVTPFDNNLTAYGNRIHELLLRISSECSNLAKEIATEISTKKGEDISNIPTRDCYYDYLATNLALNKKTIQFIGGLSLNRDIYIRPFEKIKPEGENEEEIIEWWTHYNKLKHEKLEYYEKCCLKDVIYAFGAYYILLNYLVAGYDNKFECDKIFIINPCKKFGINTSIFSPTCACAYTKIPIRIHGKIGRIIEESELSEIEKFLNTQEIKAPSNLDLDGENCLYYTFLGIKDKEYGSEFARTIDDLANLPSVKVLQPMFAFVNNM